VSETAGWLRLLRRSGGPSLERDENDARPVAEHVRQRQTDPALLRRRKLRRRTLVATLSAVCLAGTVVAVIGEGGFVDGRRIEAEIESLVRLVAEREAAVERLEAEIRRLEADPLARERLAREQLGFLRPGEVGVLLPRERERAWDVLPPPGDPASPAP
jgi:cell division protein FtsB